MEIHGTHTNTKRDAALTVAGETLVACVKLGVDSDESMLLPDL